MEQKIISGKVSYEIVREIASGGMGAVYLARMQGVAGFEKVVAIKTLLTKFADDSSFVERFIEEAKLVANLVHENIVQIYQLDRTEDAYYFVLEYVDGISLYELMEFHRHLKRTMPVPLVVFIVSRIARGLTYAHSRTDANGKPLNIVHCDVCPRNIMINSEGVPKLTDFGIAHAATLREIGSVAGKLAFMAPEQAQKNGAIDFRADIYSLGVVLFYLLSGGNYTRQLDSKVTEILDQVRSQYVDWTRLPNDLPPDLTGILHRMLAGNPAERYPSSDQMARDLEYFIYKDGYGPTIVTLANYLRELMPGRFLRNAGGSSGEKTVAPDEATRVLDDCDCTVVMDGPARTAILDKTIQMSEEELNRVAQSEGKR